MRKRRKPDKEYRALALAWAIIRRPAYNVLLCADSVLPPSPWTTRFRVEIDDVNQVIRLAGDFT